MKNNPYQPGTPEHEIYERGYTDAQPKPKPKCQTCHGSGCKRTFTPMPCPFPEIADGYGSLAFAACPDCHGTGIEGGSPPLVWL